VTKPPRDAATVRFPPPLVFLVLIVVGLLIDRWFWPPGLPVPRGVRIGAATVLAVLGAIPLLFAMGLFARSGQHPEPWKPTPEIISTGIYRVTRNPMYVGMALLHGAVGFARDSAWVLALIPVAIAIVDRIAVRPEEAYLERKFGAAYLDYKRSVRRWL